MRILWLMALFLASWVLYVDVFAASDAKSAPQKRTAHKTAAPLATGTATACIPNAPAGTYAELSDVAVTDQCVMVRQGEEANLMRVIKGASYFANSCVVTLENVQLDTSGTCPGLTKNLRDGDRLFVNDWGNGDLRLTIIGIAGVPFVSNVPLTPVTNASGVAWLSGTDPATKYQYALYLTNHAPASGSANTLGKYYRLEIFDVNDPLYKQCVDHLPALATAHFDTCKGYSTGASKGAQSNSGGGGEPPPGQH